MNDNVILQKFDISARLAKLEIVQLVKITEFLLILENGWFITPLLSKSSNNHPTAFIFQKSFFVKARIQHAYVIINGHAKSYSF